MLVIKKAQIQNFIAENDAELVRLIRQIMREICPGRVEGYSDRILDGMIRIGIDRAKKYEFENAETIASFVSVMFEISPTFDEQKEITDVLNDTNYPIDERFSQLWERIDDKIWQAAENSYDAKFWFPDPVKN